MHHTFICVAEQPYRLLVTVFRFWIDIRMWSFRIKLDVSFISRTVPLVPGCCSACFTHFICFAYSGHMSTVTYHFLTFLMSVWLLYEGKLLHTSPKLLYTSPKLLYISSYCTLRRSYYTLQVTVHVDEFSVNFSEIIVHFSEVSVQFAEVVT